MTATTTVDRLYAAGFPIGPKPDEPCRRCTHVWGNHLLAAEDPTEGGYWTCPFLGCECTGEWGMSDKARDAAQEYRRRRDAGE